MDKNEILLALAKSILEVEEKLSKKDGVISGPFPRPPAEANSVTPAPSPAPASSSRIVPGKTGGIFNQKSELEKAATFGVFTNHPAFKAAKRDGKSDQEAMQAAKDALTVRDTNEKSNEAKDR
jgi:hypothetical protein